MRQEPPQLRRPWACRAAGVAVVTSVPRPQQRHARDPSRAQHCAGSSEPDVPSRPATSRCKAGGVSQTCPAHLRPQEVLRVLLGTRRPYRRCRTNRQDRIGAVRDSARAGSVRIGVRPSAPLRKVPEKVPEPLLTRAPALPSPFSPHNPQPCLAGPTRTGGCFTHCK